jgi:hypothetical protein
MPRRGLEIEVPCLRTLNIEHDPIYHPSSKSQSEAGLGYNFPLNTPYICLLGFHIQRIPMEM